MRKPLVRAALLGAGALTLFAAIPTSEMAVASADVDAFLTDMEAAGFTNDDGNAAEIAVGRNICSQVAGGWSPDRAADDLWQSSEMDSKDDATQFVQIAILDLCPQKG